MIGRTVVILPTYNESENLLPMVLRLRRSAPAASILVVDDASPDGTGDIADDLALGDPLIRVMHRTEKAGLGAAYLAGFDWALRQGFEVVVECDADGSHHPEQLPRLLAAIEDSDVVIGSRWVPGGEVIDWPWSRRWLSRGGSAYARAMLGLSQRDVTGGYRVFRASALGQLDLATIASQGYCFQIETLWRAERRGLRIAEIPITFSEREHGASKMRPRIILEAMWRVTTWGFGAGRGTARRRVAVRHA